MAYTQRLSDIASIVDEGHRCVACLAHAFVAASLLSTSMAYAGDRLLATSGVTQVEGAAGGGLSTWAVIGGHGSSDQIGATAAVTHVRTQGKFKLDIQSATVGVNNRLELSMAKWSFRFGDTVPGETAHLEALGAKVRILGDAIYDQDRWWPQVSAGFQYKNNVDYAVVPKLLGATKASDTDWYVAATKVWLGAAWGHNLLGNLTLRSTRANQFGILGFGGDLSEKRHLEPEASLAVLLDDNIAIGGEWRAKPNQLSAFREENAWDLFVAWFATPQVSLTAAWLDLGNIADKPGQSGLYLSAQLGF